jgi:hypothetical protein
MLTQIPRMLNRYFSKLLAGILSLLFINEAGAQSRFFKKLVPHHAKLQYGGGIGLFSAGFGYTNKNKKLEGDIMYGYVPAGSTGVEIHSATLKLQWIPIKTLQAGNLFLKPLVTGVLVNRSFGQQYFGFKPSNYPYNYYKFPTAYNAALLVGSQAGILFPGANTIKGLSFYYELLSFDRELISFVNNTHSLSLDDILTLGVGMKLYLK